MLTSRLSRILYTLALMTSALSAHADTDISQTPLLTNQVLAKPNIMFVLDNSGSMGWDYTPDALARQQNDGSCEVQTNNGWVRYYGCRSAQCNGSAFNPAKSSKYLPPMTSDGRAYPNMPLTAAWSDGFVPDFVNNGSVDLNAEINTVLPDEGRTVTLSWNKSLPVGTTVAFRNRTNNTLWLLGSVTNTANGIHTIVLTFSSLHDGSKSDWTFGIVRTRNLENEYFFNYAGSQPAMSWSYDQDGNRINNTFAQECRTNAASNNNNGTTLFPRQNISNLSDEDKQHYANWYSYYRTRILTMRSAAGRAVAALGSDFRVGFSSLNDNGNFNSGVTDKLGAFTNAGDFDSAQRVKFFSNLYGSAASGGTPLRRALAKMGRYYGKSLTGQTDPVPASTLACQRNFTLLTTDGYWNGGSDPTRLDGTAIGNWDGDISLTPRPMYDGSGDTTIREWALLSSEKISNNGCGFLGFFPTYRHTFQEKITTQVAGETTSTTFGQPTPIDTCSSTPPSTPATTTSSAGAANTLADVATYYRAATLNRPQSGPDTAGSSSRPVMSTFTLGFGVSGRLRYDPNYLSQTTGDFADIKSGVKRWPQPESGRATTVDDLWHAAVNGGGVYYAASDPLELTESLKSAFNQISAQIGTGASAASSSQQPIEGKDQIYVGSYVTDEWYGNLRANTLKTGTTTAEDTPAWEAGELLKNANHAEREIYYMGRTVGANGAEAFALRPFTFDNLSSDADATSLTAYFSDLCDKSRPPSQCPALNSAQRNTASGVNLVNFIRGDQSLEGTLYRQRKSILGPIVDASPVYVGAPAFVYADAGYSGFKEDYKTRCPVVYAAANDGMLHAFSAATAANEGCEPGGTELWAYVPRAVMSELYRLTDSNYAANHHFFVNGTPVVGDISLSAEASGTDEPVWSTILVGGFGAGGRGYYALNITNPGTPTSLWEFSDADMGLSYGNPVITKVPDADGTPTWAVAFTSGLNNSGNGYLYILNAHSGQVMYKIPTLVDGAAVGSSGSPSGLNKLNAWIDQPSDNTAARFYAGDMLGNLWRFNATTAEDLAAPGPLTADTRSFRVARFVVNGQGQPITVRPELAEIKGQALVLVGTGRYLGISDASDLSSTNSVYAIKDPLDSDTGWGDVRANTGALVEQTLTQLEANATTGQPATRTVSANTVEWNEDGIAGWYLDLPDDGERIFVPMDLSSTRLTFASLVPSESPCSDSGYSWLFTLDVSTGSFVKENATDQAGATLSSVAITGITTNGGKQIITGGDGSTQVKEVPTPLLTTGGLRRTSWREIVPTPQ